uniref:Solute carrier family 25 member 33 n=1 Tax=Esox lucius TaxID=8010 RepID=A0A6Q2YQ21_ESOLU
MAQNNNTLLHLFAGGCSGTVGAIVTCPLEVLKTRLQSSGLSLRTVFHVQLGSVSGTGVIRPSSATVTPPGLLQVLRSILEKEGPRSLFRGLGPNLVGVAPSRAIYFAAYKKSKETFNGIFVPNSGLVHMSSAGFAVTNSVSISCFSLRYELTHEPRLDGEDQDAAGEEGPRGEEDERPAVRTLRLQHRGDAGFLPGPDGVIRRHLRDHDLLPDLRDAEEAAERGALHLAKRRDGEGSVRLPGPDDGRSFLQGLCFLHSLPTRGDPNKTPRRGQQVQVLLPDGAAGCGGGGLRRLLPRTRPTAHPSDPQHRHRPLHLRTHRPPDGRLLPLMDGGRRRVTLTTWRPGCWGGGGSAQPFM